MAINYSAYNFIKIHRTLRVSPAMAAGVTETNKVLYHTLVLQPGTAEPIYFTAPSTPGSTPSSAPCRAIST